MDDETIENLLIKIMDKFPGICGNLVHILETPKFLGYPKIYGRIFKLGGGGKEQILHREKFTQMSQKILNTLKFLGLNLVNLEEKKNLDSFSKGEMIKLDAKKSKGILSKSIQEGANFENLCEILIQMMKISTSKMPKKMNLDEIFNLFEECLKWPLYDPGQDNLKFEQAVIMTCLPKIWTNLVKLVETCVKILNFDVIKFVPAMFNGILSSLNSINEIFGANYQQSLQILEAFKISIFELISCLAENLQFSSGIHILAKELIPLILKEIVPLKMNITLNNKTNAKSNKNTRKCEVSPKFSNGNPKVTQKALNCLHSIFLNCGPLIHESIHRDVQSLIISLALDADVNPKMGHFKVLMALCENPNPNFPPPIRVSMRIFQKAKFQESNLEVKNFCSQNMMKLRNLCRMRSENFAALKLQNCAEIHDKMMIPHKIVLREKRPIFGQQQQQPALKKTKFEEEIQIDQNEAEIAPPTSDEITQKDNEMDFSSVPKIEPEKKVDTFNEVKFDINVPQNLAKMSSSTEPIFIPEELLLDDPKQAVDVPHSVDAVNNDEVHVISLDDVKKLFVQK